MMKTGYVATLLTLTVAALAACGTDDPTLSRKTVAGNDAGTTGLADNRIPFEAVTADIFVPKIKNQLTGLPATDAEVQAVKKDPNALKGLIDAWMTLPSFKVRMTDFFRNGFQQNQVDLNQLFTNVGINMPDIGNATRAQLVRNIMDSFALTAWQIAYDGKPFNTTMTTRTYMMTTALASFIAYLDEYRVEDSGKMTNRFAARVPVPGFQLSTSTSYPISDTLDPASPNYMKFSFPGQSQPTGCPTTTQTTTATVGDNNFSGALFGVLFGSADFNPCGGNNNGTSLSTEGIVFTDAEFNDWRPVTLKVNAASAGTSPAFHEINKLKTASEITVHADRISFWSTPAFAANWGTNNTNEMRVTANQALIVNAGQSIESEDTFVSFPVDATDASHASNPACTGCHSQLDPFKTFFRQSLTEFYSEQTDKQLIATSKAGFAIGGLNQSGKGVGDLANIFAANPRFPIAWTAKLYFWANSTAAIETDPELLRIAAAFTNSNFDFRTLVRELFSSPLITWSAETETTKTGVINSITRRDQFCAALTNRLQLNDVCGTLSTNPSQTQRTIASRALMLATDTYFRAYALPSLPTSPDLFFRQSTEAICSLVADQVIDVQGGSKYSSNEPDTAINDFVANVMGIVSSDARYKQAKEILADNFTQSSTVGGIDKTTALKATFQLACLAPNSVIAGL